MHNELIGASIIAPEGPELVLFRSKSVGDLLDLLEGHIVDFLGGHTLFYQSSIPAER